MKLAPHEILILLIYALVLLQPQASAAIDPARLIDHRYCGQPARDKNGDIIRSAAVKRAFIKQVPCLNPDPISGACNGWQVDHVWPLAACGCDNVSNMAWMPVQIKTCAGEYCKDRWERKVYKCKPGDN